MLDFNRIELQDFYKKLFEELYFAPTEEAVDKIIQKYPDVFKQKNWTPYGNNENFFGAIENQQASPIPALVEKITNSIDAILMRKCLEEGINPKASDAPRSMAEAVERFFPEYKYWDTPRERRQQAEGIQIIADGPRGNTSLTIYDDGEGQHPENFEDTILSLFRNNKNEIHFVQGKYNMGGSGAVIFCGKNKYQLVASKRYDNKGKFGFTLIRRHPLSKEEESTKRETWYEYLKLDGGIPAFDTAEMNLKLHNRKFTTGTIIKLFSYDLPSGSRAVISKDTNQSINEYLFEPALPILTIEKKERYPKDRNPVRDLYGLKRRLESDSSKYVEEYFVEEFSNKEIGKISITCYVFKTKIDGKDLKESKQSIRREFFKNNMAALFSLNGQVHGHYTSEFITRALKYQLLKDYLLIHVDCTQININFRRELFMASRDRLKDSDESRKLRDIIGSTLRKGRLSEIFKHRKDTIAFDASDTRNLLKSFTNNLPLNNDLLKLLDKTFKLDGHRIPQRNPKSKTKEKGKQTNRRENEFHPKRFPSYFKVAAKSKEAKPVIGIPMGGERTIKFDSDVENQYFVRVEEPGELKIAIVGYKPNGDQERKENNSPRRIESIEDAFDVVKKSPNQGTIKVILNPTKNIQVGDEIEIETTLTNPGDDFNQAFWVKISAPENPKKSPPQKSEKEDDLPGLPNYILVYKDKADSEISEDKMTWEKFEKSGIADMEYKTVVYPYVGEDDKLEAIYINMDSSVLKDYKSKLKSEEQFNLAENRYISTVYFHTLFLYIISKNQKFQIKKTDGDYESEVSLSDYIKNIFENYYSQFLLNFEMANLMESLED